MLFTVAQNKDISDKARSWLKRGYQLKVFAMSEVVKKRFEKKQELYPDATITSRLSSK
jgi:hypothetical protein